MNLIEIFSIILIHWFADFVLQTDKQAKGKSKNWSDLLGHTFNYTICWCIPIAILFAFYKQSFPLNVATTSLFFMIITFISHTITDFYTSRANSQLWEDKNVHGFFVSVGFDQVLHYVQLFLTYYYLKQ